MLEEVGCMTVARALSSSSNLEEVDLRNNEMEADSVAALAVSVAGKTSILKVKVDEDVEEGVEPLQKRGRRGGA